MSKLYYFDAHMYMFQLEVDCDPYPVAVPWLDGFYALPGDFGLQQSDLFQTARIYGQDVSSGAAVAALLSEEDDTLKDDDDRCINKEQQQTQAIRPKTEEKSSLSFRVLDLCCCPGLKLCAIADRLFQRSTATSSHGRNSVVVGVDISEQRMAVCKRILHKYQIRSTSEGEGTPDNREIGNTAADAKRVRIRLYCNDGTTLASLPIEQLNLVFDSVVASQDDAARLGRRKRMNKSARVREQKRLKQTVGLDTTTEAPLLQHHRSTPTDVQNTTSISGCGVRLQLFDRVLVDAECTTDGSIIHIQKRFAKAQQGSEFSSAGDRQKNIVDISPWTISVMQRTKLVGLQRNLAATGFRLLKQGGYMVYSTCSLSKEQNEDVVTWLMEEFSDARIVPVNFSARCATDDASESLDLVREGTIPGTVQFLPNLGRQAGSVDLDQLFGGGFFLAKLVKLQEATE